MAGKSKGNPHNPGNPDNPHGGKVALRLLHSEVATCAHLALQVGSMLGAIADERCRQPDKTDYESVKSFLQHMNEACVTDGSAGNAPINVDVVLAPLRTAVIPDSQGNTPKANWGYASAAAEGASHSLEILMDEVEARMAGAKSPWENWEG